VKKRVWNENKKEKMLISAPPPCFVLSVLTQVRPVATFQYQRGYCKGGAKLFRKVYSKRMRDRDHKFKQETL